MKRILLVGIALILVITTLSCAIIKSWRNSYQSQLVEEINCGISPDDVNVELITDDRGGITGDGTTVYKLTIKEGFDTNKIDLEKWNNLPMDETVIYQYGIDDDPAGRYIRKPKSGKWRMVGKNKEFDMYGNIIIYVYDEEGRCFYIYKWDS